MILFYCNKRCLRCRTCLLLSIFIFLGRTNSNSSGGGPTSSASMGITGAGQQGIGENKFMGEGQTFKGKLIGVLEVQEARGDRMCQVQLRINIML